jgi:predicted nucleic acid-binding Zn ribbon protein
MQKFSEAPKTHCPECGGDLTKLISHCTFHLKGSGWYVTDYASKSSTTPAKKHHETKSNEKTSSIKEKNPTPVKKKSPA